MSSFRSLIGASLLFAALASAAVEPFDGPASVTASAAPGFYAQSVEVALAYGDSAAEIHYTLDGSEPTAELSANCFRYTAPITFADASSATNRLSLIPTNPSDKISVTQNGKNYKWTAPTADVPNVNVLRARAFKGTLACTNEFAGTWLVGTVPTAHTLRVVSLQTDETNFFGSATGIMVPGDKYTQWSGSVGKPYANYFQTGTNWERVVHCEIFETNHEQVVSQNLGVRVHGAWSRAWPQKTLAFYAREEYGKKRIKYPLFPDDTDTDYKRFLLRNSGNDWNETTFRDAVSQAIFRPVARHATQGYVPAVLYVNGEYWGIQNFRHQYGARFFEREYGADPDNVDYVKWASGLEAAEGDLVAYNELITYMNTHSAADPEVYAEMQRRVDIDNLIDYCLLHAYLAATDWANNNNNVGLWRERVAFTNDAAIPHDGRWRFCSYDTDSGTALAGTKSTDGISNAKKLPMFKFLCGNTNFTARFVNRSADLLNTVLLPARAQARIDAAAETIASEIPRHITRWPNLVSATSWTNEVVKFRQFFADRPAYMRNHLISHFSAGAATSFTVDVSEGGGVAINTLSSLDANAGISFPWTGTYFANIPVTVRAIAEPGWEFVGWVSGTTTNTASTASLNVSEVQSVKAVFRPCGPPQVVVNEVMADSDDVDWFELFNVGTNTVNLRGCWLRDDNANHLTQIPCDVELAPGAFQVVRTDDSFTAGLAADGALLMPFGLGKKGDELHLYSWDGTNEIASIVFGKQTHNVSEGCVPDGETNAWRTCGVSTPGAPNRGTGATGRLFVTGVATQMWAGAIGRVPLCLATTSTVESVNITVTGGTSFSAQLRNNTNLWWRVPLFEPAGTRVEVKVTGEAVIDGLTVSDETTFILVSKGIRPAEPAPGPQLIEETVFANPGYVWGKYSKTASEMTHVTTARQLAFAGAKLEELLDCDYWGYMDGCYMTAGYGRHYFLDPYWNAAGELQFIVVTVQKYDDKFVKGVVVKLTQGEDGVYAQGLTAIYRETSSSNLSTTDFVALKDDGTVDYQNYKDFNTIATTPSAASYGVACLNAMKWLKASAAVTVYPGKTVDDVKDCSFSAVIAGGSTYPDNFTRVMARNVVVTTDETTGKATKIRMELQLLSDGYIKCVIVQLTDGTDGVQAQVLKARYVSASSASLGYAFVNADGSYAGNSGTVAENPSAGGYGAAGLWATRWVSPPPVRTSIFFVR